ncbi:response regulator [bacterium]|nr:response regulator [candidate division CSSED10-310 bacterium]
MNMVQIFLKTVAERGAEIAHYTTELSRNPIPSSWQHLKRIFHSLKSSAHMAGFIDLSHLATLAESAADRQIHAQTLTDFAYLLIQSADSPDLLQPAHPRFRDIQSHLGDTTRVLIIDDDSFITEIIRASLDMDGIYSITTAASGKAALTTLEQSVPDVIVLDLLLEDISGIDLLTRITERVTRHAIPVIVLTGSDEPDLRKRVLDMGAACFLQKPFTPSELIATIKQLTTRTGHVH